MQIKQKNMATKIVFSNKLQLNNNYSNKDYDN